VMNPLTSTAAWDAVMETTEQAVVRRIVVLGQRLAREGRVLSHEEFLNQSSVNSSYRNRPDV
jgi:hypothetical protein